MCGKLSPPGIYLLRWGGLGKGVVGWRLQPGYVMAGREETDMNLSWCRSVSPQTTVLQRLSVWRSSRGHLKPSSAASVSNTSNSVTLHLNDRWHAVCKRSDSASTLSAIQKEQRYLTWDELPWYISSLTKKKKKTLQYYSELKGDFMCYLSS